MWRSCMQPCYSQGKTEKASNLVRYSQFYNTCFLNFSHLPIRRYWFSILHMNKLCWFCFRRINPFWCIDYHSNSVSISFIFRFYVDNIPIREVKRTESMGADFPSKPMSLYATIWDGSDWATNGGKYRVNYKYAPYVAEFSDLVLHGCAVDPIEQFPRCDNTESSQATPTGVTPVQRIKMESFRAKFITYSYCYDRVRYRAPPSECVINTKEADRLKSYDPVTFGGGRRHHGKRHHRSRSSHAEVISI